MSGGQRQRVAIARALVGRPERAAGRRADGQPRQQDGARDHGRVRRPASRRHDDHHRHPRSGDRRRTASAWCACTTAASSKIASRRPSHERHRRAHPSTRATGCRRSSMPCRSACAPRSAASARIACAASSPCSASSSAWHRSSASSRCCRVSRSSVMNEFQGIGGNTLQIHSETSREDRLIGKWNRLRPADLELVKYRVAGISNVTPMTGLNLPGGVRNGSNTSGAQVIATTSWFQLANQAYPRHRPLHHRQRQRFAPPRRRAGRQGAHGSQAAGGSASARSSRWAASGSRSWASWRRAARCSGRAWTTTSSSRSRRAGRSPGPYSEPDMAHHWSPSTISMRSTTSRAASPRCCAGRTR